MNGFLQLVVVLHGQQRVIITWVPLQSFLSTACCHPDPGSVLIGHTFTHIPLHFRNRFHNYTTQSTKDNSSMCVFGCVSSTRYILLYVRFLLKELGPSGGSSVEDSNVLIHHLCVGFKVMMSLKAIGVNPTEEENPHRWVQCTNKFTKLLYSCKERTDEGLTFLPTLHSLVYPLITDTTTASAGSGFCSREIKCSGWMLGEF